MDISPRLVFIHAPLVEELTLGLVAAGARDLVPQVSHLRVLAGCGCGDDFCASFRTGSASAPVETVVVTPYSVLVDVSKGRLTYVEVLFRPDVKDVFEAAFGAEFFQRKGVSRRRVCLRPTSSSFQARRR